MMHRWAGSNARGLGSLKSDNALEVYGNFFTQPHVIHASNEDYAAGATVDVEMQGEDQREGRKVRVPIFLIYSEGYLGSRYDVPKVWEEWVERASLIGSCRLGEGVGHFGVEEAPEVSARGFWEWLRGL